MSQENLGQQSIDLSIKLGNVVDEAEVTYGVLFNSLANMVAAYTLQFVIDTEGSLNEATALAGTKKFTDALEQVVLEKMEFLLSRQQQEA